MKTKKKKKKKGLQQEKNTFFPKFTLSCTPVQIIGGDVEVDHSQTIRGYSQIIGGDISPHPPRVSAPLCITYQKTTFTQTKMYWCHSDLQSNLPTNEAENS